MKTITQREAVELISKLVETMGSQESVARFLDISNQYLNDILRERRSVSENVAKKLGYERVVIYKKLD